MHRHSVKNIRAHDRVYDLRYKEELITPDSFQWSMLYKNGRPPVLLDIGCGFGRFSKTVALCQHENVMGIEIRAKVFEFAKKCVEHIPNAAVIHENAMKNLQLYIHKESIEAVYILYPDPHFKHKKHKARIVSEDLAYYWAFFIRPGGFLVVCTDVVDLGKHMQNALDRCSQFRRVVSETCTAEQMKQYIRHCDVSHTNARLPKKELLFSACFGTDESFMAERRGACDLFFAIYEKI